MRKNISEEKILGDVLKFHRLKANKTQESLALDAGLDRTYISMLERGEASPTFKTLLNVSKALNVHLTEIVADFESKKHEALNQSKE